jgi:hypothetical protein
MIELLNDYNRCYTVQLLEAHERSNTMMHLFRAVFLKLFTSRPNILKALITATQRINRQQ